MINGKFWNGNDFTQIVESVCTLNGLKYKIQAKYKWVKLNGSSVCYKVYGSMKILEVIK